MKKIVLVVLTMAFSCGISLAQVDKSFYNKSYDSRNNGTFDKSTMLLGFGLGIPAFYSGYTQSPVLYGKLEHGLIRDEIGLGGYISMGWGSNRFAGDKYNFSAFSLGVLGYYHFNKLIPIEKMDVYAGAGLAFRRYNWDSDAYSYQSDTSGVIVVVKVGIRYYILNSFAVYAESGWDDMSSANFGGSFRF